MQNMLASRCYQDKSTLLSNAATIAAFGAILFVIIEVTSDMFKLTSPVFDVLSIASLVACAVIAAIYYIFKKVKKSDK